MLFPCLRLMWCTVSVSKNSNLQYSVCILIRITKLTEQVNHNAVRYYVLSFSLSLSLHTRIYSYAGKYSFSNSINM